MTRQQTQFENETVKNRAIILLDLDCFEVQIWVNKYIPELIGKDVPIVVINQQSRILSANYTAKSMGVKRGDWKSLEEARLFCQQRGKKLIEIKAGNRFGKIDSFLPQTESDKILKILQKFQAELGDKSSTIIIERPSNDEFYIDVTDLVSHCENNKNTWTWFNNQVKIMEVKASLFDISKTPVNPMFHSLNTWQLAEVSKLHPNCKYNGRPVTVLETECEGSIYGSKLTKRMQRMTHVHKSEILLLRAAIIAQSLIKLISDKTTYKYQTSAGIAHSKLMAKIACGINKPQGITVMTEGSRWKVAMEIPLLDIPGLAGTIGSQLKEYFQKEFPAEIITISDLIIASYLSTDFESALTELNIQDAATKAKEFDNICRFLDETPVVPIIHPKKCSTSITFKGNDSWRNFHFKIYNLARDMEDRILYNNNEGRRANHLVVNVKMFDNVNVNVHDNGPNDNENTIKLESDLSHRKIYQHIIKYCKINNINHRYIRNICLTSRNIIEN